MPEPQATNSKLVKMLNYIQSWAVGTSALHNLMRRDYEFVNGQQASRLIERKVADTGRELLYFNEIRPQFELLSGHRSNQQVDYVASPRGREDKRLGTVVSSLLKATYDVIDKNRIVREAADDGDICGMGAVHIGHSFDFSEDVVWGDIFIDRVSPFSFVWDVWGTRPHYKDGKFQGHRWWMQEEDYRKKYGNKGKDLPPSNQWFQVLGSMYGDNQTFEPSEALTREMLNADKKHIGVFRIYYKDPVDIYFVADGETGDVFDGGYSEEEAKGKYKKQLVDKVNRTVGEVTVTPTNDPEGNIIFIIVDKDGQPWADETGQQPMVFQSEEQADEFINAKKREVSALLSKDWAIWKRRRNRVRWVEMSAFGILAEGNLPATTQDFPYRMYISRQLGDEIEDIEGIVRQIIDRQREITKRYNHLAAHLAHSAHSGFFNKKGEGSDTKLLKLLGTMPGIVAEYNTVMPTKIEPSQIPLGHFNLLDANIGGMQRSTGINSELLGLTGSSAVSGEAIGKRQAGGITQQAGRIQNYLDFEKEVAQQTLYQIQQSMPVDKMRRILGVWEAKTQAGIVGQSALLHPVSGEPVSEDEILNLLATMKNTKFDLVLKPMPSDQTIREKQFTTALQMMELVTATGRPIGPVTFKEVASLSDLPERLIASLEADAQAAAQQAQAEAQNEQIGGAINSRKSQEGPNA